MSTFVKAEQVVSTALGLLLREITLPGLVWRNAFGDYVGYKDDTLTVRLPGYAPARTRALRSGAARTKDGLFERSVDITLDTDVYKDVGISDEEMTLDIVNFGVQVLNPIVTGIVEQLEQEVADQMSGATYENSIAFVESTDDPYTDIAVKAGEYLDNARVPMMGRVLVVGSKAASAFLNSDKFTDASKSGSTDTLRRGTIGSVAGFDAVIKSPALPSDEAYAFHQTAYAMAQRAPIVPNGAPWGASLSHQGLAIRAVQVLDPDTVENRLILDSWVGANVVKDHGHYDGDPDDGGKFVPVTDPANGITGSGNAWGDDAARLVRAVKITVS